MQEGSAALIEKVLLAVCVILLIALVLYILFASMQKVVGGIKAQSVGKAIDYEALQEMK